MLRPLRRATTNPHQRKQARWLEMFGWDWPVASTSCPTDCSPAAISSRICRRVGSPSARKYFAMTSPDVGASGMRNGPATDLGRSLTTGERIGDYKYQDRLIYRR